MFAVCGKSLQNDQDKELFSKHNATLDS